MLQDFCLEDASGIAIVRFPRDYIEPEAVDRLYGLVEREGYRNILLDFEGVGFISSTTFGRLLGLQKRVDAAGGRMALCGLTPALRRVVRAIRLDRVFMLYEGRDEALASF